ncbi:MAG: tetratricopeptide repeat protein [Treponema sp.]|jgi:TPR repeat protein|nr:tetratricopeptide repeat protein [Treponema sp.]
MKTIARIFLLFGVMIVVFSSCASTSSGSFNSAVFDNANSAEREKDYDRAIAEYTKIITTDGYSRHVAAAYSRRALAYFTKGDYENAITDYGECIRLNPGNKYSGERYAAYRRRAQAFLFSGQPEKARDDYKKALKIFPWNFDVKIELEEHTYVPTAAYIAYMSGKHVVEGIYTGPKLDRGIEYFTEAIRLAPNFASAYNARGVCYYWKGMYGEAGADYKEALRVAFTDVAKIYPYTNLAVIYREQNEFDRALDCANRALAIVPDFGDAHREKEYIAREKKYAAQRLAAAGGTKQPAASAAPARQPAATSVSLADDLANIAAGKADATYWTARAERGEARAQYQLGVHYHNGTGGVRKDMARAVSWYTRAAEGGYDSAQYNLALCYLDGTGVAKDQKKAFAWFLKAAEQGHAQAQYNAGVCYYFGEGAAEDPNKAAYWFAKSAEQRNADAQFNLALLYLNGEGVPEDRTKALFWFDQAAKNGHAKAKEGRDTLSKMGYTLSRRNSEQDMLAHGYTKAGEGVYRAILYQPFDDLKAGAIAADDTCVFISKVYIDSNFRADINTWFKVMDQKYTGDGADVISDEPGKQKFFTMIFNDRTFIPKIGDTVYVGWRIDNTANVQLNDDVEKLALSFVSGGNGFSDALFDYVPVAFAASYSENEVLEKVRVRTKR